MPALVRLVAGVETNMSCQMRPDVRLEFAIQKLTLVKWNILLRVWLSMLFAMPENEKIRVFYIVIPIN